MGRSGWDWHALYRAGRRCGLSGRRFWALTPCELWQEFAYGRERREDEMQRDVVLAWQTVRLYVEARTKGLPPLAKLLTKRQALDSTVMSPEKGRAVLEILAARFGGRVRKRTS